MKLKLSQSKDRTRIRPTTGQKPPTGVFVTERIIIEVDLLLIFISPEKKMEIYVFYTRTPADWKTPDVEDPLGVYQPAIKKRIACLCDQDAVLIPKQNAKTRYKPKHRHFILNDLEPFRFSKKVVANSSGYEYLFHRTINKYHYVFLSVQTAKIALSPTLTLHSIGSYQNAVRHQFVFIVWGVPSQSAIKSPAY